MSRSRSLSYCSLSYSWRLIRFTRRRRRSGTAWGLEKAHTHTRACTCTHAQIRHARADNEKGIQMHTCTHRHNWTQRKTDLSFYLNINITECLHTWMSGSSIRGENYVKTNNWAELLHFIIDDVLVRLTFSESDLMLRCCPRTWRRLDRPKHWNWINISAVSSTVEFSSAAFTWYLIPPLSSFVHVKTDLWALTYKRHLHRCLRIIRPQSLKSSNSIILPAKGQKAFEITTVTWLLLLRAQH